MWRELSIEPQNCQGGCPNTALTWKTTFTITSSTPKFYSQTQTLTPLMQSLNPQPREKIASSDIGSVFYSPQKISTYKTCGPSSWRSKGDVNKGEHQGIDDNWIFICWKRYGEKQSCKILEDILPPSPLPKQTPENPYDNFFEKECQRMSLKKPSIAFHLHVGKRARHVKVKRDLFANRLIHLHDRWIISHIVDFNPFLW